MNVIDVLEKIEDNGFEAYIVGGYVRDYVLGIKSSDIDICTNARVKDLMEIFSDMNVTSNEYGSVKIVTNTLRIDITTYRRDVKYNGNRRKVEIEYVDNLLDDINRRDFTMNTLCMNKDQTILDLLKGQEDIENKIIRCVGSPRDRLSEDPLRMLRAVRFATTLGFTIEDELYQVMLEYKDKIRELSLERVKEELTKILVSQKALYGLQLLKDLGYLDILQISYTNIMYVSDICGMYSQLNFKNKFPFSKEERENIKAIQKIVKYGKIDNMVLFEHGLYLSLVAGSILGIDKEFITKSEKKLPIHVVKDIEITSDEICSILEIEPCQIIKKVYDKLTKMILGHKLKNEHDVLVNYLKNNREKWLNEGASK